MKMRFKSIAACGALLPAVALAQPFQVNGSVRMPSLEISGGSAPHETTIVLWGAANTSVEVPAGAYSLLAFASTEVGLIRTDGTAYTTGMNSPAGTWTSISGGGGEHLLALNAAGGYAGWGGNFWGQQNLPAGTYTQVAAGLEHSLAIRSDGTLVALGRNDRGQCNAPSGTFTRIAGGWRHSLAIRTDGTLAAWGHNNEGQINVPSGQFIAIAAGDNHSIAIRADGTLVGWGANNDGQLNVPAGQFVAIAAGRSHTVALRADGSVAAWGANNLGQASAPAGVFTSIAAARDASAALRPAGERALTLVNNAAYKPGSDRWTIYSDRRLKTDIQPLKHALDALLRLRGVTFNWRDPASQGGSAGLQLGLIADEVEQVFPQWVGRDASGLRTLTVTGFEALTVEALRELRATQKQALTERESKIAALRARLSALAAGNESGTNGGGR